MKRKINLISLLVFLSLTSKAQYIDQIELYSYNLSIFNPASAGMEDKHIIAFQGQLQLRHIFKDNYTGFYNGILSYNGEIKSIKSGIGAFILAGGRGAAFSKKVGFSYNFNFQISRNSWLRVGVRPFVIKNTINFSKYNAIQPEEVLVMNGKESHVKRNMDAGFLLNTPDYYLSASFNNIFTDNDIKNYIGDRYSERAVTGIIGKSFNISKIKADPSLALIHYFKGGPSYLLLNSNFKFKWVMVGATYTQAIGNYNNIALNAGVDIKKRVEIIGHLYSLQARNSYRHYDIKPMYLQAMVKVKI